MILEGIVTTTNADGTVNISPMGPIVDHTMQRFVFRPYQTSRTYQNLKRHGQGVLHVTDDVELIAHAAVGQPEPMPSLMPCLDCEGWVLADACRWYAFQVVSIDDHDERTEIEAATVGQGVLREFFGLSRAKHAVLEAAILATRTAILPLAQIQCDLERLKPLVNKTGGEQEHRAFAFLEQHIAAQLERQAGR